MTIIESIASKQDETNKIIYNLEQNRMQSDLQHKEMMTFFMQMMAGVITKERSETPAVINENLVSGKNNESIDGIIFYQNEKDIMEPTQLITPSEEKTELPLVLEEDSKNNVKPKRKYQKRKKVEEVVTKEEIKSNKDNVLLPLGDSEIANKIEDSFEKIVAVQATESNAEDVKEKPKRKQKQKDDGVKRRGRPPLPPEEKKQRKPRAKKEKPQ